MMCRSRGARWFGKLIRPPWLYSFFLCATQLSPPLASCRIPWGVLRLERGGGRDEVSKDGVTGRRMAVTVPFSDLGGEAITKEAKRGCAMTMPKSPLRTRADLERALADGVRWWMCFFGLIID